MPRATCAQNVPSLCSQGVARLASADQRLPECFSHFAAPGGHLLWPGLCRALESGAGSPLTSISEQPYPGAMDAPIITQGMGSPVSRGAWRREKPLLPRAEGEGQAPRSWACQSRRSFGRPQPARLCGWSGGRPLRVRRQGLGLQPDLGGCTEGTGSCPPGLGHCGPRHGRPCGEQMERPGRHPRSDDGGRCWTQAGHSERCTRPILDSGPVNTWRSQSCCPVVTGGAKKACQEGRGQHALAISVPFPLPQLWLPGHAP